MPFESATSLLAALRARRLSAVELLEDTLRRIDAVNPTLNAIVVDDRDAARRAAARADAARARGGAAPLLGLPMTVKECFDVAGLPTTWGLPGAATAAAADAVVVQRLRAAGAVVIGKTNVSTNLADWQSANPVYGRTLNPWDPARTPGGSSGGSAAALAAGLVALEVGTDIGGSLRVPAHCCGVYAHKPTHGLVPMRGCAPPNAPRLSVGADVDLAVAGPMARCADDLALALDAIAGPDDDRAAAWSLHLPAPRRAHLAGLRVLVLREHPLLPTGADVAAALDAAVDRLAAAGVHLVERPAAMPDLMQVAQTYVRLLLAFLGASMPADEHADLCRAAAGVADDDASPAAMQLRALTSRHRDWFAADRARHGIRDAWARVFTEVDVVLCPVMPVPALPHDDTPMQQRMVDIDGRLVPYTMLGAWAGPATLAGLPATALPIGRSAGGLPIGVQAIGAAWDDRTTIAFARACEAVLGGFEAPPAA